MADLAVGNVERLRQYVRSGLFDYSVPAADHAARLASCRKLLELDAFLDVPVRQLSLGQRMRGELTAALLHGPEVLFLRTRAPSCATRSKSGRAILVWRHRPKPGNCFSPH